MQKVSPGTRTLPPMPLHIVLVVVVFTSAGLATVYVLTRVGVTNDLVRTACAFIAAAAAAYWPMSAARRAARDERITFTRWLGIWTMGMLAILALLWLWRAGGTG